MPVGAHGAGQRVAAKGDAEAALAEYQRSIEVYRLAVCGRTTPRLKG
jgi:hypothetical protein